jgi:hypothetical protein
MKGLVILATLFVFLSPVLDMTIFARESSDPNPGQENNLSLADFTSAKECGQCHQEIFNQWTQSMHSRSFKDPVFRAVIDEILEQTGEVRKVQRCLRCHAPIAGVTGRLVDLSIPLDWELFSDIEAEGVTCDFCHTISGNENLGENISVGAYLYPHRGATAIKFGRNPDAVNDSHLTEPSDFLTSSEFCAVCHKYKHSIEGRVIQNTYREWFRSAYRKQETRCQDCHMPSYAGSTADGAEYRQEVHAHVFTGGHQQIFRTAVNLSVWGVVTKRETGSHLKVTTNLTNVGAGHAIPTGVPGIRDMWMNVEVHTPRGDILEKKTFWYGQSLVNSDGADALPWEAFRILEDNRIEPQESRQNSFELPVPSELEGKIKIQAKLFYRLLSESISRRLDMTPPAPELVASAEATVYIPQRVWADQAKKD